MKPKDEKPKAPLESYYAAPKSNLKELLDISEWEVIDKIIFYFQIPLFLAYMTLIVLDIIGIEFNRYVDGALVTCVWLIVILHIWLYQKKTEPDGKPTPKRWYLTLIVIYSIVGTLRTSYWLVEHLSL